MTTVNLKFEGESLVPDDDDASSSYLLGRQVAHEYHSSAVQSYINAESAALQAAQQAAMDEQAEFRKEQTKKQAEGKAAASSFADMMHGKAPRQPSEPKSRPHSKPLQAGIFPQPNPKDEKLISENTGILSEQTVNGEALISDTTGALQSQAMRDERISSDAIAREIPAEMSGVEDPMIDPVTAGAAGAGAAFKLSMNAGKALMPSLARAVSAGVVNVATDPAYGTAAEVVGAASPSLALPFNIAVGLLGGMTLEPAIERGIAKAAAAAGKTLSPEMLREQVALMRGALANETGAVGKIDDLTKNAVIEEINAEIGKHPVDDALRLLKSQKGEVTLLPGSEGTPPAPVKGGSKKSGIPVPKSESADAGPVQPGMVRGAREMLANTNPDITKETAGNIRLWGADLEPKFLGEIETPEDIMRVIGGTHEAFAKEQESARRGVRSWEETSEEAKKYKIEDLLGRRSGQALNAEQIDNARTLLVSSSDTLRGMAQIVRSGQANDLQKADFMRAFNVHYAIQMQLSGAAAEAGRALQIFRKVAQADALRVGQIRDFMEATAANGVSPDKLAEAISKMESPAQISNFVKQSARANSYDMFLEAWINGLLSGPVTHAVNITSNALTSVWMIPERALAAGFSSLHGRPIRGGEVTAQAYGLVQGFKDGLGLAWQALKTGQTSDTMGKVEQQQMRAITAKNITQLGPTINGKHYPVIEKLAPNALEEGGVAARAVDALGEVIRIPGRFLGAEDALFKAVGYRMELQAQAFRKAASEGLEGQAMAQRIRDIIADPQNLAPEVHLAAIDAARYQTFTKELGPGGKAIQTAANKIPGAKLVVPFIRTPLNILRFAAERTPLAPLMKSVREDIMAGGARADMALARISMGSMAMAVVASYAASGQITGGGPTDTALRSHKFNTGWQPYSIKIGDKYYSYGRLEPIGMMMGLAADAVEIMGELDEIESDKIATTIVAAISKNVMSKTWLRGLSEMVSAMDDPDRYGSKYVKQISGTAIPTVVAQIERTISPEISDAQSALDAIKARVPGFSKDLPTRRNMWGEKIQFNGSLGPDIISPIFTSEKKSSPIDEELIRMRAPIRMPSRNQTFEGVTVKLDPNEYEEFMVRMNNIKLESTGKTLKKSLNELVTKDKDYKALKDNDQKERMIRAHIHEATERTRAEMLDSNPTLRWLVDDEHRRQAAAR